MLQSHFHSSTPCGASRLPYLTLVDGLVVPPRVENVEGPLLVVLHIMVTVAVMIIMIMLTVVMVMLTAAAVMLLPPPPPPPPSPRLSLRHLHSNSKSEDQSGVTASRRSYECKD